MPQVLLAQEPPAPLENPAQSQDPQVWVVAQAPLATQVPWVFRVYKGLLVCRACQEPLVPQVSRESLDPAEDLQVPQVRLVPQVRPAQNWDPLDTQVKLVHKVQQAPQEPLVLVSQVQLVPQVHKVKQAPQEPLALVSQVQLVPQVPKVKQEPRVPQEPLALVSQAPLEPQG